MHHSFTSPDVFNLVDWNAHEWAFKRFTWEQKITMAKLVHGLVNTNCQNNLYYNMSNLCQFAKWQKRPLYMFSRAHIRQWKSAEMRAIRKGPAAGQHSKYSSVHDPARLPRVATSESEHNTVACSDHRIPPWIWYNSHDHLHGTIPQFRLVSTMPGQDKKWSKAVSLYVKQENGENVNQDHWSLHWLQFMALNQANVGPQKSK